MWIWTSNGSPHKVCTMTEQPTIRTALLAAFITVMVVSVIAQFALCLGTAVYGITNELIACNWGKAAMMIGAYLFLCGLIGAAIATGK